MRYYFLIVCLLIHNNIFAETYFSVERLFADINRTQKKINFVILKVVLKIAIILTTTHQKVRHTILRKM